MKKLGKDEFYSEGRIWFLAFLDNCPSTSLLSLHILYLFTSSSGLRQGPVLALVGAHCSGRSSPGHCLPLARVQAWTQDPLDTVKHERHSLQLLEEKFFLLVLELNYEGVLSESPAGILLLRHETSQRKWTQGTGDTSESWGIVPFLVSCTKPSLPIGFQEQEPTPFLDTQVTLVGFSIATIQTNVTVITGNLSRNFLLILKSIILTLLLV